MASGDIQVHVNVDTAAAEKFFADLRAEFENRVDRVARAIYEACPEIVAGEPVPWATLRPEARERFLARAREALSLGRDSGLGTREASNETPELNSHPWTGTCRYADEAAGKEPPCAAARS